MSAPGDATSVHPPYLHAAYGSTVSRAPKELLVPLRHGGAELAAPVFGEGAVATVDADLTRNAARGGAPLGERIVITGRVLDGRGFAMPHTLLEVWQANAAGRYAHARDQHDAPLDPNFQGTGRCLTDGEGCFHFTTLRPGAYPWQNRHNAWRPSHIHFSVFGRNFLERLVTQMYFPGDPLLSLDPIYNAVPDGDARHRLVANFDEQATRPGWALGYRFDIVLTGPRATPFEGLLP